MTISRVWLVGVLLAALMSGIMGRWLDIQGRAPDLILIAIIYLGLTSGPVPATLLGFFTGLYQDLYAPRLLGHHAFAMTIIGFLAGMLSGKIQVELLLMQASLVFALGLLYEFLVAVTMGEGIGALVLGFWSRGLPVALYTTTCAVLLVLLFGGWLLPKEWGRASVRKTRRAR